MRHLAYGSAPAPVPGPARLVGVGVAAATVDLFAECFRKFKVPIGTRAVDTPEQFMDARCDGCIFVLDERASQTLQVLRASPINHNALAYGIGRPEAAAAIAHLGINALLPSADEAEVLKAVEATYLLLVRKLRRYVRVPIVTPVEIGDVAGAPPIAGLSRDISAGGIALRLPSGQELPRKVSVRFQLPGSEPISVPALVCWYIGGYVGMQFADADQQVRIKQWVDRFLGVVDDGRR